MTKLKFIGFLMIMLFSLNSFSQEIRNVRISQEGTNVVVLYDLDGKSSKHYNVNLFYTTDKGKSWRGPVKDVTGDVSYQAPGSNKKAFWDATSGNEAIDGAIQFKLTAETTTINDKVVEKTSLSEYYVKSKNRSDSRFGTIVEIGYGAVSIGGEIGSLNLIERFRLNPYFSLGIGTGLRIYNADNGAIIPIFTDFRANFRKKKTSPYLALGIGYSVGNDSGVFLKITPGESFNISKKSAINIGISYEMQNMNYTEKWYSLDYSNYSYHAENSLIQTLSLNVGISF